MQYKSLLSAFIVGLSVSGVAAEAAEAFRGAHHRNPKVAQGTAVASTVAASASATATASSGSGSGSSSNANLQLNPSLVQTGSESNGIDASSSQAGQAASATDNANFINFCAGKTLTNGLQVQTGSCNGIVMGDIPAKANMVSTVITFPQNNQVIAANTTFNFSSSTSNMVFGSFTNAQTTYYAAPQTLDKSGNIIGHLHFTVQLMGSVNPTTPLDPTVFAFFKGVNDAGDNKGDLQAIVAGGLKVPGNYRVCTMTSASNHQPVIMPVAQRGPQDDCVRFTVAAAGSTGSTGTSASSSVASVPASTVSSTTATGTATPKNGGGSTTTCTGGKKHRKGSRNGRRATEFEA